jgi:hypothetical protein
MMPVRTRQEVKLINMCFYNTPVGLAHFRGRDASGTHWEITEFCDKAENWVHSERFDERRKSGTMKNTNAESGSLSKIILSVGWLPDSLWQPLTIAS